MPDRLAPSAMWISALALAACSGVRPLVAPDVPEALRPPAGQTLFMEALAYEWAFKAPEASLAERSGYVLGKHYAGPTWESNDGSAVVGEVKARDPGPTAGAIPWLLLSAKSNTGAGEFSSTKSIQRVATSGGVAPGTPCAAANLGQVARVPYTATYYFYR
jgi:hypothetical protein